MWLGMPPPQGCLAALSDGLKLTGKIDSDNAENQKKRKVK